VTSRGFRRLLRIRPGSAEVEQELQFHLDSRIEDLVRRGATPSDAHSQALAEFGDLGLTERELTASRRRLQTRRARADWRSDLMLDAKIAWRGLLRRPGLAASLLLILGLASGACGAIFTVVRAAYFAAMPYPDPGRLLSIYEIKPDGGLSEASWPDYMDWRSQAAADFKGLAGYEEANVFVGEAGDTRMLRAARVTAEFFDVLGSPPNHGRGFRTGEDGPGGTPIAVLSHGYWQRQYGGDPTALGRIITINETPYTIVGILPRGFHFAPAGDADLWLPLDSDADLRTQRSDHWLLVVGRMAEGTSLRDARASLELVMSRLAGAYPESNKGRTVGVTPLRDFVIGEVRPALMALSFAVGLVLIIACANAAGLLLSRTLGRARELSVRMAIGATRGRVVRQLVTESLLAGLGGAAIGVIVARLGVRYLIGGLDDGALDHLPFFRNLSPDVLTIGFLALLAVITGVGSGLAPALVGARADAIHSLAGSPRPTTSQRSGRLRDGLVAGQLALTLALLSATALMARSLLSLLSQDLGFQADQVLTGRVALSGPSWESSASQQRFFQDLIDRAKTIPGVRSAGAISSLPLNSGGTNTFRVEGEPEPDRASQPEATRRQVAGDYFQSMGIPLLAGRVFTPRDDSTAQPAILVSASLAKRYFPGGAAVGRRLRFYRFPDTTWEVIGVVGDVTVGRIDAELPPIYYFSHLQVAANRLSLTVRTATDGAQVLPALRAELAKMGPGVALYQEAPMTTVISDSPAIVARRYPLRVIGAFAAVAILLAVAGVYGVVSNNVAERRREIGIRSALGANTAQLVGLILRRGALLVGMGLLSGGLLALLFSRALGSMLYGVRPGDPVTLGLVTLVLGVTTLVASWWPARRAGRVDPAEVLREE
jgi:predicted permease